MEGGLLLLGDRCQDRPRYFFPTLPETSQEEGKFLSPIINSKNAFSALLKLLRNREGAVNMHRACGELTVMAMLRAKATVAVVQSYGFVLMRKLCCVCMESNHILVENGAVTVIAEALRRFPNDTILQYSDTVCQQLAKAASPSPKKGRVPCIPVRAKHSTSSFAGTHRPPKGSKTKARATDRVVLDVQLPIVSAIPPHRDIQAAVQITESHMVQENKVIAAYGGAPCKQHLPGDSDVLRHATNRFRPSPSDPNLPLLGHSASGDGKHEADAKRPSRPAKPSSKHAPTTPPKVLLAPAIDPPPASSPKKRQTSGASPQAKKGGRSVNDAQKTNVSTRQTSNAAIDVTVAAKAPPARSSSVGVSPRLATPKVVVEHAWGDPLENPSQPTSPVRPSHRKFAPAAPAGNGASVFRFRHAVGTSGRRSPVVYDSTGEYPHLVKRATAPSIHQRPPPEKKNDSMTAKLSSEQQAPLLSDLADVCQSSVADESSFTATSRTNGPPDHRLLDGPSNTPLALSEMAGDMTQAPASDSAGGVPLTHPLMELPRHEDPLHAEEARSRQVDPVFVAKPCVVHLPCHDEDAAPVHLDPAMLDSILGEAMAKAPPSGRRFLPMTPANTFVGLENAGIPLPGCSPSPVQSLNVGVVLDTEAGHDVEVSLLACQLARSWLYDGIVRVCDPLIHRARMDVQTIDVSQHPRELSSTKAPQSSQEARGAAGMHTTDDVSVLVSLLAGQLVRGWSFGAQDRILSQHDCAQQNVTTLELNDGDGEPRIPEAPAIQTLLPTAMEDYTVAMARIAKQLVDMWLYVSVERMVSKAEVVSPTLRRMCGFALEESCQPGQDVSAAFPCQQQELEKLEQTGIDAVACSVNRLVVGGSPDKEYARDDDFIDEGDMSALPLACTAPVDAIHEADADDDFCVDDSSPRCTSHASVPREVSLHDDLSSDKVSVYVSILAHQLIQSWLYGAIARRCAGLAVDNGPMAPPPRLKVCGEVDKVTMAEPHATGLSVAASVLAGQLVQSWIFQTLENVVLFKTQPVEQARLAQVAANAGERVALPQKSEPSCVAYLQPDDQNACDGNDEKCPVLVALFADRVTKAWILEAVLNVTDALLPPLALTPSMANVVVVDDGIRRQGNSATSIPPILFFDEGELRHVDSCDFTAAAEGKTPLVRVSLLAAQLVAGWVYLTMDEVLRFSTCRSNGHVSATSSPSSPRGQANEMLHGMGVDGVGPSETGRVSAYDAVDGTVAISMMAKQLVHGWVYECLLCVVDLALSKFAQAPMIHDTAMALVGTDDATMDDGADVVLEDRPVAVSVFTGHLVRLWLYEAVDKIVEFSSLHPDHEVVDDVSLHGLGDEPRSIRFIDTTKVPESTALSRDDRLDSTSDESLEVALLASLLVRAWTSDAIRNIVERCQPDGSAHKTTVNSIGSAASDGRERHLDGPTCSKFVPVAADCPWTNRSDGSNDDVSLEEVLLSNLLVRAWMGEAVLRVMCSAGTSCETVLTSDSFPVVDGYNALASEIDPPCGHETWTVGDDEERDGAFETGTSTEAHGSMEAVLLANLLVRAWTAEAMLRIMDATPPSEPVAASTPAPNALPDTNHPCAFDMVESSTATCCPCRPIEVEASRASAADDVPLELVLLANLFVRAWTSDAMQLVLDYTTTCDLPPPTTSPEGLHQLEPKQPKRPPSPHDGLHGDVVSHTATKPPLSPRLPDTIATDGEVGHDMTLEIVLLANLLVRAWVAEASMNVVDAAVEATQNPSLTSTRLLTNANPLAGDGGTSVVASTATDDDPRPKHFLPTRSTTQMVGTAATHTASASDETGVQFEEDSSFQDFSLEVFLLANLLVRAWVAEATELVSRSALLKGCVIQCTVPDEVTRLESKQETHVEVPFAPFVSPVAIPTRPSIDLDQHHIAAIFTRWNSGDVSHVSFRRLEGVYLKGAACVEDWIQAYVAAPVASAIAHVGTCQCPRQMAHLDDRDDEVATALLASQMTRYWIFEALFNVSKKQLQHALGTTKTWG
ncbi:hypothetical protein DYB32_004086 [Aphanomyces invadans]|uniref:Uncharacterized protein n=1 Tax=Aphanomyces invadans TaxID=157072 RepID=A0A3R7D1Q1_9STRA|nr:hypothetical protein DYB32_004086 [Aphanomyces invadans]